jgi:hypothetical protein
MPTWSVSEGFSRRGELAQPMLKSGIAAAAPMKNCLRFIAIAMIFFFPVSILKPD